MTSQAGKGSGLSNEGRDQVAVGLIVNDQTVGSMLGSASETSLPKDDSLTRLAFVAFQSGKRANGGIQSLYEIASRLKSFRCELFTQSESERLSAWEERGVHCHVIPGTMATFAVFQVGSIAKWNLAFWRHAKELRPDVVVCNDIRAIMHAGFSAWWLGIPLVFFVRDTFEPGRSYTFKWRFAYSLCRRVVCLSGEMAAEIRKRLRPLWGSSDKTEFLYSIVDRERLKPVDEIVQEELRSELGVSRDEFAIVYVASVCNKKNQLELLANVEQIFRRVPRAKIHFVGDFEPYTDTYSANCQQVLEESSWSDRVVFHGYTDKVANWYRAADCILVASRREGLARCMIESLACGTPVVSFDVTSAREILEQYQCGLVVKQGDFEGLAEAIEFLEGRPEERLSMGAKGAAVAEQLFSEEANLQQFTKMILRVVGE